MKQLYRSMINGQMYYCYATKPIYALKFLRSQSLRLYGKFNITELYVRESEYKWSKLQLTTKLLMESSGQ